MKPRKKNGTTRVLKFALKVSGIILVTLFILSVIGIFFSPQPFYTQGFRTLTEVKRYAAATNELTPLESENAVKPDFTNYYKRFSPSVIKTIKDKLGGLFEKMKLKNPPAFTPSFFKTILEEVNKMREQKGCKKDNIVKIAASAQSKFIVIGDLQGAFHSLVRDLAKLKEMGILADDLKIMQPDCYIIFLGNVPSRSPFSMEILGLVLRLMQQNPDCVLYTKGSHETDGYWEEHTLKTELKVRTAGILNDAAPLIEQVNKLFDSLPTIIYLSAPAQDKNAFVRFSHTSRAKLPDKNFYRFLMSDYKEPVSLFLWQGVIPADSSAQEVNVKAILRVEKKRETYQPSEGLRTLAPEMGVTTWTLLSGPTLAVEQGFKFYNDTFALIEAAPQIDQWKITLYYQDRRQKDGYKTKPFFLTSGRETAAPSPEVMVSKSAVPVQPAQSTQAPTQLATSSVATSPSNQVAGTSVPVQPSIAQLPAPVLVQPAATTTSSPQTVVQPTSAQQTGVLVPVQPAAITVLPAPQSVASPVPQLPVSQPTQQSSSIPAATPTTATQPVQQVPLQSIPSATRLPVTQSTQQPASTQQSQVQSVLPAAQLPNQTSAQIVQGSQVSGVNVATVQTSTRSAQ